jgi:hypothetical protein
MKKVKDLSQDAIDFIKSGVPPVASTNIEEFWKDKQVLEPMYFYMLKTMSALASLEETNMDDYKFGDYLINSGFINNFAKDWDTTDVEVYRALRDMLSDDQIEIRREHPFIVRIKKLVEVKVVENNN